MQLTKKIGICFLLLISFLSQAQNTSFDDADQLPVPPSDGIRVVDPNVKKPYKVVYKQGQLVDLHSHVFHHGLGIISGGDYNAKSLWADWSTRYGNKINEQSLIDSGLGLVVVALYAHPILGAPMIKNLRQQIKVAREFVQKYPHWAIARNAAEAKKLRSQGKNIMVFSLEGANGVLNTDEGLREFIDEAGISIVTFAHLIDDELTGAALMSGHQLLANPISALKAKLSGSYGKNKELINPNGLTKKGQALAHKLAKRGVWIDLAHSSDKARLDLVKIVREYSQPLLFTHTGLRQGKNTERALSSQDLEDIRSYGGVIGLVPAESVIGDTVVAAENCPKDCQGQCHGGIFALATQFNLAAKVIGPEAIFLGSDFNGAMDHLKPSAPCKLGSTIDKRGLANASQTEELWRDLLKAGAPSESNQKNGVDHFISIWSKVQAVTN